MFDEKNNYKELETIFLKEEIENCDNIEDLKEVILPKIRTQQEAWSRKIKEIIDETGYTDTKFAKLCNVSRVSVNKWRKGSIPKDREKFIRIGMVAGYSVEKINQLLQRYGQYPALYSKSLEDCVCIYVLSQDYGSETINKYEYILNKIKQNIIKYDNAEAIKNVTTEKFDTKLSEVQGEDELEQFIADNIAMFSKAYHTFYAYVKANIVAMYEKPPYAKSVFEIAQIQSWSSSLRQCVSEISQLKWYPTRNKIISLGLHLSMDREQVDEMLALAHMEPLCAKNILESVIIFILEDASLNNKLDPDVDGYDLGNLCYEARKILSSLELPEIVDFISELPEETDEE